MRIHSDKLTESDLIDAAHLAGVAFATNRSYYGSQIGRPDAHGSRKRARAFNVLLRGASKRRPNGGPDSRDDFAATWDQWGAFLGYLYALDSELVTPYYSDVDDFNRKTFQRFIVRCKHCNYHLAPTKHGGWSTVANKLHACLVQRGEAHSPTARPLDEHGDHTFRPTGTLGVSGCTKCTAEQTYL